MSSPAQALLDAGLVVHDARVAPRPGAFEPLAVFWHHVGDTPPRALQVPPPSLKLCQDGREGLPGPLCQWLVDGDGGWWWITDGKANHAGAGSRLPFDWLRLDGVRPDDPPTRGADDFSAGNRYYEGVEVAGNGNWSSRVHYSMLRGTRALLHYRRLRIDNVISHAEHTRRKVDPAGISMRDARAWLRQNPTPPPPPLPNPPGGTKDMLGPILADKTGADPSQVINIDGTLYVIDQGDTSAAFRELKDANGKPVVDFIPVGAVDYAQFKQAASR